MFNISKSTYQILEEKKLNPSKSCRNLDRSHNFLRHDGSSIIAVPDHSKYFKISQNESISAKRVYKHYLQKSAKNSSKNFTQFLVRFNTYFIHQKSH